MKKNKILGIIGTFLLIGILATACNQKGILPKTDPLTHLQLPTQTYTFDASVGDTLLLESGGYIAVPPNSLVKADGTKATGKISLNFTEIHDAFDALTAGLSMGYDTLGQQTFTTAGMFKIGAEQNGDVLEIDSGYAIEVSFGSFTGGNGYNFYKYNNDLNTWAYEGTAEPEGNPLREKLNKELLDAENNVNRVFGRNYFALNYMALMDVYFSDDYKSIYKKPQSRKPGNKARQYDLTWLDLPGGGNRFKHKGEYEVASFWAWRKLSRWPYRLKDSYLDNVTAISDKKVEFDFYNWKTKTHKKLYAEPIISLKLLFEIPPEKWINGTTDDQTLKAAQKRVQERLVREEQERQRILAEAKARLEKAAVVFRTMSINTMGSYNWDKIYKQENKVNLLANYNFPEINGAAPNLSEINLYYFFDSKRAYIAFSPMEEQVQMYPDSTAFVMAVMPDNSLSFFNNEAYKNIDFSSLSDSSEIKMEFLSAGKAVNKQSLSEQMGIR